MSIPIYLAKTSCAQKSDRLGWTCGASFEIEGASFGIRSNCPETLASVIGLLPGQPVASSLREVECLISVLKGGQTGRRGVFNYHLVFDNWNRVARTMDFGQALQAAQRCLWDNLALHSRCATYILCRPQLGQSTVKLELETGNLLNQREGLQYVAVGRDGHCQIDHGAWHPISSLELAIGKASRLSPGKLLYELARACPQVSLRPQQVMVVLADLASQLPVLA